MSTQKQIMKRIKQLEKQFTVHDYYEDIEFVWSDGTVIGSVKLKVSS